MLQSLFKPRPALSAGRALYTAAARKARDPAFYLELGVADTGEGRFELYCLHVALLVRRLKGQGAAAADTSQALFDAFVRSLDDGLREMGVGDLVVGKRMRRLGEAFYGRLKAYEAALDGAPDAATPQQVVARTVSPSSPDADTGALAAYLVRACELLGGQPLESLLQGKVAWPEAADAR